MTVHRRLAAIMFTDIAGYSALMAKDEKLAMNMLEKNREIHKSAIAKYNGEYIKEVGDGTLAIFHSSLNAVSCALLIHRECVKNPFLKVRIGIHIGDIIVSEGDVFGDGVNIASRIEATGEPGGIYISEKVYDDIRNKSEIKSEFLGEKTLKNIDHPVKIYSIDTDTSKPLAKRVSSLSEPIMPTKLHSRRKINKTWRKWILSGLVAVILVIVAIIVFVFPLPKSVPDENRIVVALFENRTGDPRLDELGTMAADWITQGLSQAEEVNVVPTTTVIQLSISIVNGSGEPRQGNYLGKLAETTKAGLVVSGMYYLQQEQLQFQVEVKNVRDGSIVYAFPAITGSVEEPMALLEKLSNEIIGGLTYHFRWQDINFVSKPPNKDAYCEYMVGLELFGRDDETASRHFIKAVILDSLFLPPQFYIASAYSNHGAYSKADSVFKFIGRNRERLSPYERHHLDANVASLNGNYTESLRYLHLAENISPGDIVLKYLIGLRALRLNKPGITIETCAAFEVSLPYFGSFIGGAWWIDNITDAYHLLGDFHQELAEARKGQQHYPDWFRFYSSEIRALSAMGRTEEIKMVIDRCQSLSSQTGTVGDVITTAALELRAHGYVSEGQEYAIRAVEWYRNRPSGEETRHALADALYISGEWQQAQPLFEQLATEKPQEIDNFGFLGTLAARRGDREKAMFVSDSLKRIDRPYLFGQHTYWRARIASLLGERKEAVELLQESFAQGRKFGTYLHCVIDFEPLKDYPPYQELLKPKE
jgi:class 3 adenylate cyclase/tetratricopeptide (TPR) repeat protein